MSILLNQQPIFKRLFTSKKSILSHYDVIINGAGIVGATLCSLLSADPLTSHLKTVVFEKSPKKIPTSINAAEAPDFRVYAINAFSKKVFEKIGAWQKFKRTNPFTKMEIYDVLCKGRITLNSAEKIYSPEDYLGHIIEDKVITSALKPVFDSKVIFLENRSAKIFRDAEKDQVCLKLSDGNTISTDLLIGSDGANSQVLSAFDFALKSGKYGHKAVVATLRISEGTRTAFQRFLPLGPIGFLPLHDNYASLVWSTSPENCDRLLALSDTEFAKEVNDSFRMPFEQICARDRENNVAKDFQFPSAPGVFSQYLGSVSEILFPSPKPESGFPPIVESIESKRYSFPLSWKHVESYGKKNVFLVGDAAHSIHPLAGQGLNMGIRDAFYLHQAIREGLKVGERVGSLETLAKYESNVKMANKIKIAMVDNINRVYRNNNGIASLAVNFGMNVINNLPSLKGKMIKFANDLS